MQEQMPQEMPQQGMSQGDALKEMIVQTAQAIDNIAQALGQMKPEVGEALAQVGEQFRGVIGSALQGGGQQQQGPSRMQDPMAQGAKVSQAY